MPRVKRGFKARQRRNKVLKLAKGYRGARSKLFRSATEAVDRALNYAFRDRRVKKRDFRALWITRINAAARLNGLTYSKLIHGLKLASVEIDRKVLADLAVSDPAGFSAIAGVDKGKWNGRIPFFFYSGAEIHEGTTEHSAGKWTGRACLSRNRRGSARGQG